MGTIQKALICTEEILITITTIIARKKSVITHSHSEAQGIVESREVERKIVMIGKLFRMGNNQFNIAIKKI